MIILNLKNFTLVRMRNSKIKNLVLESLRELKAVNTVTINVRKMSYFTDYLVITTGTSSRHITALSEKVIDKLKENKINLVGVEGHGEEEWVLIDIGDIVLHLMSNKKRSFYDLESLWDADL